MDREARSVRVVMTEAEAAGQPVIMDTFDAAVNGVAAELHCQQPEGGVKIQPLGLATALSASVSSAVSSAERFASSVDAALELTVHSGAGGSLMHSALQSTLAVSSTNLREQSCLVHCPPLVDGVAGVPWTNTCRCPCQLRRLQPPQQCTVAHVRALCSTL